MSHSRFHKHIMESFVRILKSSVAVKQWMCSRIIGNCFVKGFKYKMIVVACSYLVRNDSSVEYIKYCTQINLFNLSTYIVFGQHRTKTIYQYLLAYSLL